MGTLCLKCFLSPFYLPRIVFKSLTDLIPGHTWSSCSELVLLPLGSLNRATGKAAFLQVQRGKAVTTGCFWRSLATGHLVTSLQNRDVK